MGSVLQIMRRLLVLGVGESCRAEPENSTKTESRGEGKGKEKMVPHMRNALQYYTSKLESSWHYQSWGFQPTACFMTTCCKIKHAS